MTQLYVAGCIFPVLEYRRPKVASAVCFLCNRAPYEVKCRSCLVVIGLTLAKGSCRCTKAELDRKIQRTLVKTLPLLSRNNIISSQTRGRGQYIADLCNMQSYCHWILLITYTNATSTGTIYWYNSASMFNGSAQEMCATVHKVDTAIGNVIWVMGAWQ